MKLLLLLVCVAITLPSFGQSKPGYDVTIHVVTSRITSICGVIRGDSSCKSGQVLTAMIGGHRYELQSETFFPKGVVALGDYSAKLIQDDQKPTGEINRVYDLMFPNHSTRKFKVIGEMEGSSD